jgi:ATP-dependent Zn protease
LLIFVAISLADLFAPREQYIDLDYNTFLAHIESGKVAEVVIVDEKNVTGTLKDGAHFQTIIPSDPDLYNKLVASGTTVKFMMPAEPSFWADASVKHDPRLSHVGSVFSTCCSKARAAESRSAIRAFQG